jgi:hypothetical protein
MAGVAAVPLAAVATLAIFLAGPGGRAIREAGEAEREAREAERERNLSDLTDFNDKHFGSVERGAKRAEDAYRDAMDVLEGRPHPDPTRVQAALRRVVQARTALMVVGEALRDAGPYESSGVEDIRQRAENYVQQLTALLELVDNMLQTGETNPEDKQHLQEQEKRYEQAKQKWEELPRERRKE